MARQPRQILPGVAVHLVQRGNNRNPCFNEYVDYLVYLSHLRALSCRYECALHAYCLMTNHVHLLMTPGRAEACGLLMRDLGRSYVRYFNRRHGRTGTLWEGRFHACLAESARYVLACYRYIELNPVRAGLAREPADYRWSSHRANSGSAVDAFIKTHPEFLALGEGDGARRAAYRQLFDGHMDPAVLKSIRDATVGGYPLASDAFKSARLVPAGWRTEPGKPGPRAKRAHAADDCEPA